MTMPDHSGDNRENHSLSYLTKVGTNLLDAVVKRFLNPRTVRRNRFLLLITTALLLSIIILPKHHFATFSYKPGDISSSDIRATQDYLVEDKALTEQRRKEAATNAPLVYSLNTRSATSVSTRLVQALETIRREQHPSSPANAAVLQKKLSPVLETTLNNREVLALSRIRSEKTFLSGLEQRIQQLYQQRIVLDGQAFTNDSHRGVEVIDGDGHPVGETGSAPSVITINDARQQVTSWKLPGIPHAEDATAITALIARMLLPNLYFNSEASEHRAKTAQETVRPVLYKVLKGEMIVRTGERITLEQANKLQTIFQRTADSNRFVSLAGIFTLIVVLFYFPYRFACKNIRKFNPSNKDILLLSLFILGSFLFYKVAIQISTNIGPVFPSVDANNYYYLLPFAAGAMMVRILINSEVALVYCAILSPLLGIMFDGNMFVVIYALLGSIVGAHGVRHCSSRNTIYSAGLRVSVVNLCLAMAFQIFNNNLLSMQTLYISLFAVVSGILNAGFISGFIPLIETLFHYTTDIKLLELANLNSPILRDLMVRAPGTYHHSVVVGNLVEAAAEAINANPLLARVAAYYHDIGKASKAHYFIENQGGEENRHDKLTPSMSALILISHIKEGAELAREKHLGQPIIDIIRQHHGTTLIKYFYDRAKTQASSDQTVEEKNFRYPGPKPQTREAGIVMLADCVEAASRTLSNPTPDRIQGLVQKLINNIFIDGQLDECELTLKNLHEIAKSFNRILNGIFHHRIEYPEPAHKQNTGPKKNGAVKSLPVGQEQGATRADSVEQPSETSSDSVAAVEESSSGDIKRLGMS